MLIIPFKQMGSSVLNALIEEFVSRDGTDYGVHEVSLSEKVQHIKSQLESNEISLCYDEASESCNFLPTLEAKALLAAAPDTHQIE